MNLNKSQLTAVSHFQGPCCVLAGPGSGKTAVITQRTKNLITEYGINPSNILVITFTKAAAMEMRLRFERLMGEKTRVTFGTFHAVFFMVLKYAYHMESSNVIAEEQRYQLMRELIAHYPIEYRDEKDIISGLLNEISLVKNSRLDLEHFYSSQCGETIFRALYREYDTRLRQNRWIDFDDMLTYTYELFAERKDILAAWQRKYQYILIDEFQDINPIQYDIIRMMALPENNLFIVGDDDQSIYRFRGSKPEIMLGFGKDYPQAAQLLLDTNYRCDANVVRQSLNLISHNKARFAKEIRASRSAKQPVIFQQFSNQREENLYLVEKLNAGRKAGQEWKDFAVLFRTNTQPRFLMEMLMQYNIPFRIRDHVPNLYEHWIARDIFTYIRIAQGSRERKDFLQIMNRPKRYIGRDSLQEPTVSFEVWAQHYSEQPWIAERIERMEYDARVMRKMSPYAAINYIRKGIGYDEFLEEYADYRHVNKEELLDVLEELHNTAKGYSSYTEWNRHIQEYSDQLKRMSKERGRNTDAVTLATFHSAKGLEFPSVFIIDANEGIMPYKKAVLDAEIEEERRMFYVGMTRAIENLSILFVKNHNNQEVAVSRFVREAQETNDQTRSSRRTPCCL